jgi:two-component system copper resistance phosphate regulon response regulator CusR
MKLLVVEDEVKLAEYLRKGLTEEGYVVDVAHNGVDGLHLAMEGDYELLVLDGMLPGIDGLGLLAALRQSKQTPVLMLTARIRVEDRVKGLQAGADDYLIKPFAFSELVARIEVLLRRARPPAMLKEQRFWAWPISNSTWCAAGLPAAASVWT